MKTDSIKNKAWYALYTSPRAEKQVQKRIKGAGIDCWLPLHKTPRIWSDRVKIVEVPLFNSYVFVNCTDEELRKLPLVYGVSRIVFYDGKPAVIKQSEIDSITLFLEKAANHTLCIGEEVEILCGALKNVSGKIKRIKKNYLLLHLDQLDATVCVNIEEVVSKKTNPK